MLSLIICSKYPSLNEELARNIEETIGSEYEIVHIDNSENNYNIFQAYNLGVERAKGDILCFMHEDIHYHSNDWGNTVEKHLSNSNIGAIGVAGGSVVLGKLDWRYYGFGVAHLIQGTKNIEEYPKYYWQDGFSYQKAPSCIVAVLDGVWMCMKKELFRQIRFDDEHFNSFHLYDSDICMQINKTGKNVVVIRDIILEHKSKGTFTKGFLDSLNIFFKKWHDDLPLTKGIVVSQKDIDIALSEAQKLFDQQIAQDAITIELNKVLALKNQGLPYRAYTDEEKALMDKSAYEYRCKFVVDKSLTIRQAWDLVKEYGKMPYATKKIQLLKLFIKNRILGIL